MHPTFWKIFVTPGSHKPLVYEGEMANDRWKDGVLKTVDSRTSFPVRSGIPDFVPSSVKAWSEKDIEEIRRGDWIRCNWESQIKQVQTASKRLEYCKRMAESDSTILDVASGPGGGNMPGIAHLNPEAKILMSDLGAKVLYEWQNFLKKNNLGINVSFAAFDATSMPIHSNSLDVVTSFGGLSNIPSTDKAVSEVYRILKKQGNLFIWEGRITRKSFSQLPKNIQAEWEEKLPHLKISYKELLKRAEFSIIEYYETGEEALHPDEAELPSIAAKHGVTLYYVGCYIHAEKK